LAPSVKISRGWMSSKKAQREMELHFDSMPMDGRGYEEVFSMRRCKVGNYITIILKDKTATRTITKINPYFSLGQMFSAEKLRKAGGANQISFCRPPPNLLFEQLFDSDPPRTSSDRCALR
jgi:hypothetical protein